MCAGLWWEFEWNNLRKELKIDVDTQIYKFHKSEK